MKGKVMKVKGRQGKGKERKITTGEE